jgi:CRISPR-associated protein Csb1
MSDLNTLISRRDVVAIVLRQALRPAAGAGTPVFPATYAEDKARGIAAGYCISELGAGRNVCVIDSVQSQAGRIEALLQLPPYRALIRPVAVGIRHRDGTEQTVDVLAAAHRIFDAVFRFSSLQGEIQAAVRDYSAGRARPLAELAPLALICGAWDSRGEKLQLPRAFSSEIVAQDVSVLRRGAQYTASVRAVDIEGLEESGSVDGLDHVPSQGLGGVIAARIERRVVLSLVTLRRNARAGEEGDALLRYLGALALVVLTMPTPPDLRSGCLLLPEGAATLRLQRADGQEEDLALTHEQALAFACEAAQAFGVPALAPLLGSFDPKLVKGANEAKAARKTGKKGAKDGAKAVEAAGSGE